MKFYISGAITNNPNYEEQFNTAEEALKRAGHEVINPARVNMPLPDSTTHDEYMHVSFALMDLAEAVFMLENWVDSKGAHMEFEYAMRHKMTIAFEGGR